MKKKKKTATTITTTTTNSKIESSSIRSRVCLHETSGDKSISKRNFRRRIGLCIGIYSTYTHTHTHMHYTEKKAVTHAKMERK